MGITTTALLMLSALVPLAADETQTSAARVHETGDYPRRITPHPGLGKFKPARAADRPITAFYGGIGLHDQGGGRWTGYGITDRADVDRLIDRCRQYGMNRIYASLLEQRPSSNLLLPPPAGHDDLILYAIEKAHAAGIEVYADLPVFGVSELDKPFRDANPQVLTRNERGEQTPHMFSPAYPRVRAYKRAIILEWLSRFPVDGVQLDFIRWPYFGDDLLHGVCAHGYDEPLLEEMRRRYALADDFRPKPDDPRFFKIRQEFVTLFIRELREALDRNGIQLPIGVYNSNAYGRLQSLHDVCQDWKAWEVERLVDEHHPMFVLDSITRLVRATRSLVEVKRPESIVFGPVFLAEGFQPEHGFAPTAEMCRDAARRLIKLGCDGIWFCRASEIEEFKLWPVVREISEYSISRIRAEPFDPLYENLIPNGGFENGLEGWKQEPGGSARLVTDRISSGRTALRIDLRPDRAITLTQMTAHTYSLHHVYGVRSLGLAFSAATDALDTDAPVELDLLLLYSDGHEAHQRLTVKGGTNGWDRHERAFAVTRKSDRTLKSSRAMLRVPAGRGTIWLDDLELIFDPLDNPLQPVPRATRPQ